MQINRETFEAWLFTQPDERTYNFIDYSDCLLCKFIKETTNIENIRVGSTYFRVNGKCQEFDDWLMRYAIGFNPKANTSLAIGATFGNAKLLYTIIFGNPTTFDEISSNGMTSRAHAESVTIKQNENTTSIIAAG